MIGGGDRGGGSMTDYARGMSLALPLLVLVVASLGLAYRVEPFAGWYFQWAWWCYVLAVDAANHRLAGRSLLRDEPRRFAALAAVSVVLWTAFEAFNLRLGNWYYVMDHPVRAARYAGGVVAFATVLPAILETDELLARLRLPRSARVPPLAWSRGRSAVAVLVGVASLALPLAWPDLFFALTWVALAALVEPFNRRHAARSFLRELERGDAAPLARVLLAGLACGGLWETWNQWARVKWIYTVPGFESLKVFEMPLLGFLGFPPFAVGCVAAVAGLEALYRRASGHAARRRALLVALVVSGAGGTIAVFEAADAVTVDSYYAPVAGLEVLPPADRSSLASEGLESPEELLRALGGEAGLLEWSERTGIETEALRRHRERVALVMHRGLGERRALQLEALGIRSRQELARWSPEALAAALRQRGKATPRDRFLERRVRVWLEGLPGSASE